MEKKHTKKKHTDQESEHEELMGEAPSITVPDVSEHTDEEGINNDTAMPVHQNGKDEIEESDTTVHDAEDDEEELSIPDVLPVLPLKDTVIYPFAVQPLGVGQERSIRLIDEVMRGNRLVVLVAQKSAEIEQAGPDDIFKIGTVWRVARMIRMPDGTIQIIVQGLERVAIGEFTQEKPYLIANVAPKPDKQEDDDETEAIKRNVVSYFQ